ncbi:MAG: hypothetical protein ACTHMM_13815 [Agriterribacter sp.]
MKSYLRLLQTIPFVVVTYGYYKIANPDEICNSPLSAIIILAIYCFLLLTGILATMATFGKRQSDRRTPEPFSLSILLITLLFISYNLTLRGHRNGEKWIYAENKNASDMLEPKGLTLRRNGNFTFYPNNDCAFSGEYKKMGDTIVFNKEMIDKAIPEMTTIYLMKSSKLVPLFDTANKITFTISNTE